MTSDNKLLKVYPKNSFDRFGDDLCKELLSCLSLEEAVLNECVSKQWRRSVYQKQYNLIINKNLLKNFRNADLFGNEYIERKPFEVLLKKCEFVKWISISEELRSTDQIMQLIIKYCNYLTEISVDFNTMTAQTISNLFDKFGSKLESIKWIRCRRLTKIDENDFLDKIRILVQFKRLKRLDLRLNNISILSFDRDMQFGTEVFITSKSMKCKNLKYFALILWNDSICNEFFHEIDINLPKLEYLALNNCLQITDKSLNLLSKLPNLQNIYLFTKSDLNFSESDVKKMIENWKQIKEIKIKSEQTEIVLSFLQTINNGAWCK